MKNSTMMNDSEKAAPQFNFQVASLEGNGVSMATPFIQTTTEKVRVKIYPEVWLYVSPIIFLLGVAGNILTILVMKRRRLRRSTTAVYLILLAIADSLALVWRIPAEFFEAAGAGIFKDINRWSCRFEKFLFYTFSDIAIWILVLFTIDRFIAVCLPFYKAKVCLPRRAMMACGVTSIILIGKNFHVFWTRGEIYDKAGIVQSMCGRTAHHFEHYVRPWIALTTITLMPFLIIVTCNISIVVHLVKARHKVIFHQKPDVGRKETSSLFQRSFKSSTLTSSVSQFIPWNKGRGPSKVFTQTTLMCLSTSVAFLICVSPSIILTLGRINWSNDPKSVHAFGIAQAVNYQLSCLNHAINFFLYCLSGQRFRRELCDMIRGRPDNAFRSSKKPADLHKASASNSFSESKQDNMRASTGILDTIEETSPRIEQDPDLKDAVNSIEHNRQESTLTH